MKQQTIGRSVTIKGVGLHTGKKCQAIFHPAPDNHGIKFMRIDLPNRPILPATIDHVVDIVRGTTLGIGDDRVYTIEHLLSAANGFGLDNLLVELDENEPPVGDGSAKIFADAFLSAGIVEQHADKQFFTVQSPIEYVSNLTTLRLEPYDKLEIHCEVDYNHPMIRAQKYIFPNSAPYASDIAPARTFCFDYEIEALKKTGLAKGGSLDNAIVIGPGGIYNPGQSLRFDNEFVRHKILDLMGDLMLIGRPLLGRVTAIRCGHGHNIKFLRQLLGQPAITTA